MTFGADSAMRGLTAQPFRFKQHRPELVELRPECCRRSE
jgi:hypothetical protein